jgi:DNA-binding MarR family transcriptional regulator
MAKKLPDMPKKPQAEVRQRGPLAAEVRQRKPFASLEQEVFLNILRTADLLDQGLAEVLKPFALTATQYNVLRILRGAGGRGLACRELGARMLTHDPDVTRLLDRLDRRGLLERRRELEDRRVILTGITAEGRRLLEQLDEPVAELHRRQLGHLGEEQLRTLIDLLEGARG